MNGSSTFGPLVETIRQISKFKSSEKKAISKLLQYRNSIVAITIYYLYFNFVVTPRNFIIAKLSIRKPGSSSMLIKSDLF